MVLQVYSSDEFRLKKTTGLVARFSSGSGVRRSAKPL
jgi:hypothetical protein